MLWLFQFLIAWSCDPQNLSMTFAALSVAGACGANPRAVMWLSAALYLLLALI